LAHPLGAGAEQLSAEYFAFWYGSPLCYLNLFPLIPVFHWKWNMLISLLPDWEVADAGGIYAMRPPGRYIPAKTRYFIDWVSKRFAKQPWGDVEPAQQLNWH
jgi:hypothetical protein